jgi:N-acetylglucosamine kinase-like BadF-type ATPase
MPEFYLGIDGGQSSTTALIADDSGRVLGRGKGGPCNHVAASEGRAKFRSAVGDCVRQACEQAGLDSTAVIFASACFGFSGGPEDKDVYARELIRSRRYKITHDAEIALWGATAGEPGIIIIAGTGSMAFGRNEHGETSRAGGWGYVFGDEGGAFDLVRRALRAALQCEEGWGAETTLKARLLHATGAPSVNALLHAFYTAEYPRTRVATLAPEVSEAADEGDEVADDILHSASAELVRYTEGVYRKLFRENERPPVAYIGGVFRSGRLCTYFSDLIERRISCNAIPPKLQPAAGALLEALRLDGNTSELSGAADTK